jgi:hypothetical protein
VRLLARLLDGEERLLARLLEVRGAAEELKVLEHLLGRLARDGLDFRLKN